MSYGKCFGCFREAELNYLHYCSACQVSRSVTKAAEEAASRNNTTTTTTRYVYVDDREWWEKGWVWFWLIVCWPIGYYGLYKRYPKTMIRLGVVIIALFVLSKIVEFFKGLFS